MASVWDNPAMVAEMVRLWSKGVSATNIALQMRNGLTRNSIIGKVHRMGLTRSPDAVREGKLQHYAGLRKEPRAPRVARSHVKPPKPGPQNRPALVHGKMKTGCDWKETALSDEGRAHFRQIGMTLVERVESGAGVESLNARPFMEGSGCKWPLANGMRCCNPIARGAYCDGHAAVAFIGKVPTPNWVLKAAEIGSIDLTPDLRVVSIIPVATAWDAGRKAA